MKRIKNDKDNKLKTLPLDQMIDKHIGKPRTIFWLLIGWTVLGFLTNLDYTQQWGSVVSHEPIFSNQNIKYSVLALALLTFGYFIPLRQIGALILTGELLFWLYKLFIIKGGYAVGFGGVPAASVLTFDLVALTLRFLLLKQVASLKFNSLYLLIPAFLIMALKVSFFQTQQGILTEFQKYPEELENRETQIIGEWIGISKTTVITSAPDIL